MRRADRLFALVQLLRTYRRPVTAAVLAERLGVSPRTVYRDIQDLSLNGVPVRGEAGVGYLLDPGFDLPPLMFNVDELAALVLGMRVVAAFADQELGAAAQAVLAKVEQAVPAGLRPRVQAAPLFSPVVQITAAAAEHLRLLRHAIDHRRKVRFGYRRADGARSTRTVWPLGLFFWGREWTLGAWCELRGDFRNFRIDRMAGVEVLEARFDPNPGRDLADFLAAQGCASGDTA